MRSLTDTVGLLDVYRTAVLATTVGALPADIAARRRPAAARLLLLNGPAYRAELAWLDGVLAAVTLDTAGLVAARGQASSDRRQVEREPRPVAWRI